MTLRNCLQILLLILNEYETITKNIDELINQLLLAVKLSEKNFN